MTAFEHARLCSAQRRLVAWLGHAPGLWLFYREAVPVGLRRANLVAVLATLIAMTVAALALRAAWVLFAWLAGHVVWGTVLAWRLPRQPLAHGRRCRRSCGPRGWN